MRRVLVLTPDFPPGVGGIQTLAHRLTADFSRYAPRVVAPTAIGAATFDRDLCFPVTRVVASGTKRRLSVAALNGAGLAAALRHRPDVILSMHIVAGPAALLAGRMLGKPVVQYAHAQELEHRPALAHHVLSRADAVVAVSRHTGTLVERVAGAGARVHVVHPGVGTLGPEPLGREVAEPSVVVVARLTERYKGHDVLLRAMAVVGQRVPGARLQVIGDGPLRRELELLAHQVGVADMTTFHGRVADAERDAIMSRSAVFAMPSRLVDGAGEGFGIAYVEAGAQGLPVVAGRVAGALDAVIDGETGLLVDPEDHVAVADALSSLDGGVRKHSRGYTRHPTSRPYSTR
jgi:phosphatidylinositol alpha-1,6-mannosyltransferase